VAFLARLDRNAFAASCVDAIVEVSRFHEGAFCGRRMGRPPDINRTSAAPMIAVSKNRFAAPKLSFRGILMKEPYLSPAPGLFSEVVEEIFSRPSIKTGRRLARTAFEAYKSGALIWHIWVGNVGPSFTALILDSDFRQPVHGADPAPQAARAHAWPCGGDRP
jgi:hypothetical protein